MTKGDLDGVNLWGRPVKPLALGISLIMVVYAVFNILDEGVLAGALLGHMREELTNGL